MRSTKSVVLASTFLGSLALAGGAAAAPLCPAFQGLMWSASVERTVTVRIHHRDRDNDHDRVRIERVKDIWVKRKPGQPTDALCISLTASQTVPPYFIQVLHTGTNNVIVDKLGNINFQAANFHRPVAVSFNLSNAMLKPELLYQFNPDWTKDICIVKIVSNPPPKPCANPLPGGWTPPTVEAWSGAPPMDILSMLSPNTPNEQFDYTLTLWDRYNKPYVIDPKIVNQ